MRVGILGGTGFVGSHLTDALSLRGHRPVLLVRRGSEDRLRERVSEVLSGDLSDQGALQELVDATEALIYNVGILREDVPRGNTCEAGEDVSVITGQRRFDESELPYLRSNG